MQLHNLKPLVRKLLGRGCDQGLRTSETFMHEKIVIQEDEMPERKVKL